MIIINDYCDYYNMILIIINLGIASNMHISIDPVYSGSLAKDLW